MSTAIKPAHTPTPWQVIEREETPECCDFSVKVYDLHSIAADSFPGTVTSKTDAALIVRAVNSHAELVAALETSDAYLRLVQTSHWKKGNANAYKHVTGLLEANSTALAKAQA